MANENLFGAYWRFFMSGAILPWHTNKILIISQPSLLHVHQNCLGKYCTIASEKTKQPGEGEIPMEYVYIALLLLACFVPAGYLVLKTNQAKKRGCGRGCATCGNKNFCHRSELRVDRKR